MRGFIKAAALLSSTWVSALVIPDSASLNTPSSDAVIQYRKATVEDPEVSDQLRILIVLQFLKKLYSSSLSKVASPLNQYDVQCTEP